MPYNVFAEYYQRNCACVACNRATRNARITNQQSYSTAASAARAYAEHVRLRGRGYTTSSGTSPLPVTTVEQRAQEPRPQHHLGEGFYDQNSDWHANDGSPAAQEAYERFLRWETADNQRRMEEQQRRDREAYRVAQEHARVERARRAQLTPEQCMLEDYRNRGDPRHNYTHKPRWRPNGPGPLFIGPELEVTCGDFGVMGFVAEQVSPLGFLKRDSSVRGFELVTHPMDFAWAMENFPWKLLGEMSRLGCTIDADTNGLHMHVSRAGFAGYAHQLRWVKFIYRNKDQVSRLARRRSRYGTFTDAAQAGQYSHIQIQKAKDAWKELSDKFSQTGTVEDENAAFDARDRLNRIARGDRVILDHYAAINLANDTTFEMRMFAASLGVVEVKAAFQFASASVEYTRQITAHDVTQGGWGWLAFSGWLRDHENIYPELTQVNRFARVTKGACATYSMASKPRAGM